jgi:2-C-methyl-D-erythritol 4-phosphate cytidylyltransferase
MVSAIIVAAGRGTRMGPAMDKLFLCVEGAPIVAHTWRAFEESSTIGEIILVVRKGMEESFTALATELGFRKRFVLVEGGIERQDSVWNGLSGLSAECEVVAVQDGARPCTSQELILKTVEAAREFGAAVAAQRVTDTIKESLDGLAANRTLDRSKLWAIQTPQCFWPSLLKDALYEVRKRGLSVTDDAAACELIGRPARLVESPGPNPKATAPADLPYIETLLRARASKAPGG